MIKNVRKISVKWKKNMYYKSIWLSYFFNFFNKDGNKNKFIRRFLKTNRLLKFFNVNLISILFFSFEKLKNPMTLTPIIISGKKYQVPTLLSWENQYLNSIKSFVKHTKNQDKFNIENKFIGELTEILIGLKSASIKEKNIINQTVVGNRALLHFNTSR